MSLVKAADPRKQAALDRRLADEGRQYRALRRARERFSMDYAPTLTQQVDFACWKSRIMGGEVAYFEAWEKAHPAP